MLFSSRSRSARAATLVLYALAVGVGQGWHYFAHPDACHGIHAGSGHHGCACCDHDSPFAKFRRQQDATELAGPVLRSGGHQGHQCHECTICQALAQMVGDQPQVDPPRPIEDVREQIRVLSEQDAPNSLERFTDARGPPV